MVINQHPTPPEILTKISSELLRRPLSDLHEKQSKLEK